MNQTIKMARLGTQQLQTSSLLLPSSLLSSCRGSSVGREGGSVRFMQATSDNSASAASTKLENMADNKTTTTTNPTHNTLNVMEEAFGAGYSTRSDEEGFGGIYGGNDETNTKVKILHDPSNHDSSQGSHVKEKEKGRNQTHIQ